MDNNNWKTRLEDIPDLNEDAVQEYLKETYGDSLFNEKLLVNFYDNGKQKYSMNTFEYV